MLTKEQSISTKYNRFANAIPENDERLRDAVFEALSLYKDNQWISVEDELPEFDKKVLVCGEQSAANPQMGGAYVCFAHRTDISKTSFKRDAHRMQDKNQFMYMRYVTHWMPIPQKPKPPQELYTSQSK